MSVILVGARTNNLDSSWREDQQLGFELARGPTTSSFAVDMRYSNWFSVFVQHGVRVGIAQRGITRGTSDRLICRLWFLVYSFRGLRCNQVCHLLTLDIVYRFLQAESVSIL